MKNKLQTLLKKSSYWMGIVIFGTILGLSLQFTRAWVEPTVAPPGGNIGAPINTGSISQTKNGYFGTATGKQLVAGGVLYANQGIYVPSGSVRIGSGSATQKLDVAGYVKGTGLCIGSDCRTSWPAETGGGIDSYNDLPSGSIVGWCRVSKPYNMVFTSAKAPGVSPSNGNCGCESGWSSLVVNNETELKVYVCVKD